MKRFKDYLVLAAGLGVVAWALALSNAGQVAAESPKPVEIVGTPNVNVANTPDVMAHQAGEWNVGINGNVMVRDVDRPADQPFQVILCHQSGDLLNPRCPEGIDNRFTVPLMTNSGANVRRLVIEHVSGQCSGTAVAENPELNARLSEAPPNGFEVSFNFFVPVLNTPASATSLNQQTFAQPVRIYADPGTDVTTSAHAAGAGFTVCQFQVNGYLAVQ